MRKSFWKLSAKKINYFQSYKQILNKITPSINNKYMPKLLPIGELDLSYTKSDGE